jgi:hypothetical protein
MVLHTIVKTREMHRREAYEQTPVLRIGCVSVATRRRVQAQLYCGS